jgi:integrase/recombinase XerD
MREGTKILTPAPQYALNDPPKGGEFLMSTRSVWVSWRDARKRWEVGFKWEGRNYQFYSWEFQGRRFAFTKENKHIADEYAAHLRSLMRPNMQGIVTFDPGQLTGRRRSVYSFSRYVKTFLDECEIKRQSGLMAEGTVDHYRRYHRLYWDPAFKNMDIREVNAPALREFYLELSKKSLSKKYKENIMKPLATIIKQACQDSMIHPPKFPAYKQKDNERPPIAFVSEDAQDRVIAHVPAKHRGIVRLVAYHGLRQIEARNLEWKDLDMELEMITVRTAKGGVPRYIKMDPQVVADINREPRSISDNYVFHFDGRKYKNWKLWNIIRTALDKEGLQHISPHAFSRHSHATHILQRGGSSRLAQKILGHSNIKTTERYLHVLIEDQEKIQRGTAHVSKNTGKDRTQQSNIY